MRALFITMLFLSLADYAAGQQSLPGCVKAALEHNPGLKMAESEAGIAEADVSQARAARLPALDFSGSYRRQSDIPELNIDFPLAQQFFPDGGFKLGSLDNTDMRLTVTQPIFTGSRLSQAQSAAKAVAEARKSEVARQRGELIFKVESAYAGLLRAQKGAEIARSAREQIAAHLRDVETMVAQGLARQDERLRVEVKASEADLALLQAENGVALASAVLENLLAIPLPEGELFAEMGAGRRAPGDLENSLQVAAAHRPELASLAEAKHAAEAGRKIARGGRLPSLAGFASYGYGKPGLNFIGDAWMDYWLVGVGAEWNLWNWGKSAAKIEQAELRLQGLAESERLLREGIALDVKQAHLRLTESAKRLEVAGRMAEQAQASFAVTQRQYLQGQASNTDYFDAQSELTRARLLQAEAEIESALARANWRRAVGLSEEEYLQS
jgi:outer membrane protein